MGKIPHNKKYNKFEIKDNCVVGLLKDGTEFYLDVEEYDLVKNVWWREKGNRIEGVISGNKSHTAIHRLILDVWDRKITVDHIDRNIYNNRKNNLRIVTPLQNSINKSKTTRNKSGIIGVHWQKRESKWCAQITYNRKTYSLGNHSCFKKATIVRLIAELKYFGKEFAPQRHLFEEYGVGCDE